MIYINGSPSVYPDIGEYDIVNLFINVFILIFVVCSVSISVNTCLRFCDIFYDYYEEDNDNFVEVV